MATAARAPFAGAQPAEVRAVLLVEQRPELDHAYQHALQSTAEPLTSDELR